MTGCIFVSFICGHLRNQRENVPYFWYVVRRRLYWTIQIAGWLFYAAVSIVASFLVSGSVSPRRGVFLFYEALIFLMVTHLFRIYVNKHKWINLPLHRLS